MRGYLPPNRAILRVYAILEGVAHSPGNSLQNIQNCLYPKGERDATTMVIEAKQNWLEAEMVIGREVRLKDVL